MNQISNVSNVNLTLRPGVPAQVRSPAAVCVHHVPSAPPVIPPLVLHPQTYGPCFSAQCHLIARGHKSYVTESLNQS